MRIPHPTHAHQTGQTGFEGSSVRHYDRMARFLLRRPYRRVAADALAQAPRGARILDIGTGPGRLLVELARLRQDVHITGVDLSGDMVEAARRNVRRFGDRVTAVTGDVAALPFDDAQFDLIVSSLSLHHWADPEAGAAELTRVLSPAGQIRIYDVRSAPFAAVTGAVTAASTSRPGEPATPVAFRVSPLLPRSLVHRLVL